MPHPIFYRPAAPLVQDGPSAALIPSSPAAQREYLLPLSQAPILCAAFAPPASPHCMSIVYCRACHGALNATCLAGCIPPPAITILDATHRIVRIDVTELNLGENHGRKSCEDLIDAFTIECAGFGDDRDASCACPAACIGRCDLTTLWSNGRTLLRRAERTCHRVTRD